MRHQLGQKPEDFHDHANAEAVEIHTLGPEQMNFPPKVLFFSKISRIFYDEGNPSFNHRDLQRKPVFPCRRTSVPKVGEFPDWPTDHKSIRHKTLESRFTVAQQTLLE